MAWSPGASLKRVADALAGLAPGGVGNTLLSGIFPGSVGAPPRRGTQAFLQAYSRMPLLRAVVGRIAYCVASTQWQLFVVKGKADERAENSTRVKALQHMTEPMRRKTLSALSQKEHLTEITDHLWLDLMNQGNAYQTGLEVRKSTAISYELVGEAFWMYERQSRQGGLPVAVWPIPAHWITATPTPSNPFFRVSYRGWQGQVPVTEILWFREPDPDNPYWRGSGIAQSVSDELEVDEYAAKAVKQFFINGARPDFLVSSANLSREEALRLERDWLNQHQGFWRWYKPRFMSADVKVHELGSDFRQSQLVQLRQHERDLILHTWGVPPEVLGIIENCVDQDTECLTRRGWLRHEQLTESDEIATWNIKTDRLEWQQPSAIHRYDHDGPMHHWRGARVDFLCTPQHRMFRGDKRDDWRVLTSEEHARERGWFQWRTTGGGVDGAIRYLTIPPHISNRPTRRPDDDGPITFAVGDIAYFLGAFIAEGFVGKDHRVEISQNEGAVADRMRASLAALDLGPVTERRNRNGTRCCEFRVLHKGLAAWLREEVGLGARNKRLPEDVFEWPRDAQELLVDGLMDGDGSRHANGAESYGTASERLADDVQRLLVIMGYPATKQFYGDAQRKHPVWTVATRRSPRPIKRGNPALVTVGVYGDDATWVHEEQYRGVVWCVSVENGVFFTRRNGKVVCHGNSNRATIQASEYLFGKFVLIPRLEAMRALFQERMLSLYDERLVVEYISPVERDREFVLKVMSVAPWSADVDEWRELQGRDPMPEDKGKIFPVSGQQFVEELPVSDPEAEREAMLAMLAGGGQGGGQVPPGAVPAEGGKPSISGPNGQKPGQEPSANGKTPPEGSTDRTEENGKPRFKPKRILRVRRKADGQSGTLYLDPGETVPDDVEVLIA